MTVRFSEEPGLSFNINVTTPARALNTNFTPSLDRPTLCIYSCEIGGQTTLLSGDDGVIELRSDTAVTPTTVRCSMRNRIFQALGVTVGTQTIIRSNLVYLVPPGHNVRLVSVILVAAPTFAIVHQTEITL